MTDNEKRAHDIAVAALVIVTRPEALRAEAAGDGVASIDIYQKYLDAYNSLLNAIQRDFPSGT